MKLAILGLAIAALLPLSAQAAGGNSTTGVTWNYVEAGYTSADWFDENLDGFKLAGSVSIGDNWYASADYRQVSQDEFTLDNTNINLGWHHAFSPSAEFLAEVGYVKLGVDIDDLGDESSDGYRGAIGVRGMLAPQFEAEVKAMYTEVHELDGGEFGARVGATWHFNPTWGLTGSYEHTQLLDEDMNIWGLGVRASF